MLSEIKKNLGIRIKGNEQNKKIIDSLMNKFTSAYQETEILKSFLEPDSK